MSGVIDRIGPGVCGLQVGQRVSCRYVWGAFAEYIVCKPFHVHVVPDHLRDEDISPIEVLPGIIHAAELSQITTNTDVVIMGRRLGPSDDASGQPLCATQLSGDRLEAA